MEISKETRLEEEQKFMGKLVEYMKESNISDQFIQKWRVKSSGYYQLRLFYTAPDGQQFSQPYEVKDYIYRTHPNLIPSRKSKNKRKKVETTDSRATKRFAYEPKEAEAAPLILEVKTEPSVFRKPAIIKRTKNEEAIVHEPDCERVSEMLNMANTSSVMGSYWRKRKPESVLSSVGQKMRIVGKPLSNSQPSQTIVAPKVASEVEMIPPMTVAAPDIELQISNEKRAASTDSEQLPRAVETQPTKTEVSLSADSVPSQSVDIGNDEKVPMAKVSESPTTPEQSLAVTGNKSSIFSSAQDQNEELSDDAAVPDDIMPKKANGKYKGKAVKAEKTTKKTIEKSVDAPSRKRLPRATKTRPIKTQSSPQSVSPIELVVIESDEESPESHADASSSRSSNSAATDVESISHEDNVKYNILSRYFDPEFVSRKVKCGAAGSWIADVAQRRTKALKTFILYKKVRAMKAKNNLKKCQKLCSKLAKKEMSEGNSRALLLSLARQCANSNMMQFMSKDVLSHLAEKGVEAARSSYCSADLIERGINVGCLPMSTETVPIAVLPFLDVRNLALRGCRKALLTRRDIRILGTRGVSSILNEFHKARIFAVVKGGMPELVLRDDPELTNHSILDQWLIQNKSKHAEYTSADNSLNSIQLGDYFQNRYYKKSVLGTINLRCGKDQKEDMDILEKHPYMRNWMPTSEQGGLSSYLKSNPTAYGPFTFGGYSDTGSYERISRRQACNKRFGFFGSTMHLDGMGSSTAAGIIKHGIKRIIFIEAEDALFGLKLAGFLTYAKPGGSEHVVNDPINEQIFDIWTEHGIRFGILELRPGDVYFIPAGIPHEFRNMTDTLSIAWNCLPHGNNAGSALSMLHYSMEELERDTPKQPDRRKCYTEHSPEALLMKKITESSEQIGF